MWEIKQLELLYILFCVYFIRVATMYALESILKEKRLFKEWFKIKKLFRYLPFLLSAPLLLFLIIILTYRLLFYFTVLVFIPFFFFIICTPIIMIILVCLLSFIDMSLGSLIYLSSFLFLFVYAQSQKFQTLYIKILIWFGRLPNSEFSTNFINKYSEYIRDKHSLSLQVYLLYGIIYLVINVIKFTEGMFESLYDNIKSLLENINQFKYYETDILVITEVLLNTDIFKEALVTFAIFDFMRRELKQNFLKRNTNITLKIR